MELTEQELASLSRWALLMSTEKSHAVKVFMSGGRGVLLAAINTGEIDKYKKDGFEVVAAESCNKVFAMAYKEIKK